MLNVIIIISGQADRKADRPRYNGNSRPHLMLCKAMRLNTRDAFLSLRKVISSSLKETVRVEPPRLST